MKIKIALAGNPNCGKTTLFNKLTGSNQYVGNWPGVTVEKKEGGLKGHKDAVITDLPGIYSLSPYTLEEVVARQYLLEETPDVILNIVDGTNLERNLYLTTQLCELGIPVVIAVNMMDLVAKNGDKIDFEQLGRALGCKVVGISALEKQGIEEVKAAAMAAASLKQQRPAHQYSGPVEHVLAHIEEAALHSLPEGKQRWFSVKLFERDSKALEQLNLPKEILSHIDEDISRAEEEMDDDSESIITNERYIFISSVLQGAYRKHKREGGSTSDSIDKIVTNRWLALPIFVGIMWLVYTIAIGTIGDWTVGFMNDTLFADTITPAATELLEGIGIEEWLVSLIVDGIIGGVGSVLGFVPQLLILFFMLAILEDVGYMARVAFIMDRLFRRLGLSGKSFIPMLVASGCGVPGIMASRTIEQDRDRKMTIMTTCFVPCSAKMPIVGLIAAALFGGEAWVATSAYFVGIAAVVISGLMLKKTKLFAGEPAPFVMELPAYHMPQLGNVLRATWERGWSFIKRAGTVILAASVLIWVLNSLTLDGGLHYIGEGEEVSILQHVGEAIAVVFAPLGFGTWQAAVATILGLVAKEEVVGVFGALSSMADADLAMELVEEGDAAGLAVIGKEFFNDSKLAAYSFMIFNLLCAPCFAAMGAIRREMNNPKWTVLAIGYMCGFAYAVSLIVYQLGLVATGEPFTAGTAVALIVLCGLLCMMFRKGYVDSGYLKEE